jgi:hypothetical protein
VERETGSTIEAPPQIKGINLGVVRDIAFIVTIFAFFGGFSYYTELLDNLGLSSNLAEIPLYNTLVYSFAIFTHFSWFEVALAGVVLVVIVLLPALPLVKSPTIREACRGALLVSGTFASFFIMHGMAVQTAANVVLDVRTHPKNPVKLMIVPASKWKYDRTFSYINENERLMMLMQTADTYYVLAQYSADRATYQNRNKANEIWYVLPRGHVYAIPKKDVTMIITRLPKEYYVEKTR